MGLINVICLAIIVIVVGGGITLILATELELDENRERREEGTC